MSEWTRLTFDRAAMTEAQREIYDGSVAYFGGPYGPRLPLLFTPDLHEPWAALGAALERSELPARLRELAILETARFWECRFVALVHEAPARAAGVALDDEASAPADEQAVRAYVRELLADRAVSDPTYARVRELLGVVQQVELTVVVGHYTNVALMLNAHAAPIPEDAE